MLDKPRHKDKDGLEEEGLILIAIISVGALPSLIGLLYTLYDVLRYSKTSSTPRYWRCVLALGFFNLVIIFFSFFSSLPSLRGYLSQHTWLCNFLALVLKSSIEISNAYILGMLILLFYYCFKTNFGKDKSSYDYTNCDAYPFFPISAILEYTLHLSTILIGIAWSIVYYTVQDDFCKLTYNYEIEKMGSSLIVTINYGYYVVLMVLILLFYFLYFIKYHLHRNQISDIAISEQISLLHPFNNEEIPAISEDEESILYSHAQEYLGVQYLGDVDAGGNNFDHINSINVMAATEQKERSSTVSKKKKKKLKKKKKKSGKKMAFQKSKSKTRPRHPKEHKKSSFFNSPKFLLWLPLGFIVVWLPLLLREILGDFLGNEKIFTLAYGFLIVIQGFLFTCGYILAKKMFLSKLEVIRNNSIIKNINNYTLPPDTFIPSTASLGGIFLKKSPNAQKKTVSFAPSVIYINEI